MRSFIEILAPRSGDFRQACATVLVLAAIMAAYALGLNRNLVFVIILIAVFTTLTMLATSVLLWIAIVATGAALAAFPMPLPPLTLVDPALVTDRTYVTTTLPPNETWEYSFTLTDLPQRHHECGPFEAVIYVDGQQLSDASVDVRVGGASPLAPPKFAKVYYLDQIQLATDLTNSQVVTISLTGKPGASPVIRVAPETDGTTIYSDAVFLELKNARCTVIYETTRQVVKTGQPLG